MQHRATHLKPLASILLAACAALSFSALADAWVSVPSTSSAGKLEVTGGGFTAGQILSVEVTNPVGTRATLSRTINSNGRFTATLSPMRGGMYSVDVKDSAGGRIGGGNFIHMPQP